MKKSTPRSRRHRKPNSLESEKQKPFFSNSNDTPVQAKEEGGFFQPKLEVSPANDPQEKEADAVADNVVKGIHQQNNSSQGNEGQVNRMGQEEEPAAKLQRMEEEEASAKLQRMEEEEPVAKLQRMEEEEPAAKLQRMGEEEEASAKLQRMEEEEPAAKLQRMEEEEPAAKLQRRSASESISVQTKDNGAEAKNKKEPSPTPLEQMVKAYRGKGMALPNDIKAEMEGQFNVDFSKVNIHTSDYAAEMCEMINAQAFTYGYDIYFNAGKFNPDTDTGKNLLAHELTHVVQQKGG